MDDSAIDQQIDVEQNDMTGNGNFLFFSYDIRMIWIFVHTFIFYVCLFVHFKDDSFSGFDGPDVAAAENAIEEVVSSNAAGEIRELVGDVAAKEEVKTEIGNILVLLSLFCNELNIRKTFQYFL